MTYIVSGGALNSTLTHSLTFLSAVTVTANACQGYFST